MNHPTPRWLRPGFASLLLLLIMGRAFAADARFWQLTFTYGPQALVLERAALIPPMDKVVRTPGLEDATIRIDYDLEWIDVQGRVAQRLPVTVPLRGRVIMGDGPRPLPHENQVRPFGAFVLRVAGPEDPTAVALVRLVRRAAANFTAPDGLIPPLVFQQAEQTFVMPAPKAKAMPAPGPISATKVRNTGADGNRFVIAVLCDGFTAADLGSGTFATKVTSFLGAFFGVSPWSQYQNVVNVYRVDLESAESGADYEDAAPGSGGTQKDTYLNAAFWVGGTERCVYLTGNGESRAFAAADDLIGPGVWDEVLVFVNSTKYGGCGGSVGVSSINSSSDEIQIHEFGHSFGALADEYDYGSTSTNCNATSARNVDCSVNFPGVKWDVWVTPGAPIPTPDTAAYTTTVGAFEGANYQTVGMFRPKRDCRMRTLGVSFCPVCKEGHILKLFEKFKIVDAATPAFGVAEVPSAGARQFSVQPVNLNSFSYRWFLGGVLLPNATNASLFITNSQVTASNLELRVEATHVTTNVRATTIVQSNYAWFLKLAANPSVAISDVVTNEGHAGSKLLRFPVTLSFQHTALVTVNYHTTNGSAVAGADYIATSGTLNFAAGLATNFINVPVLGDTLAEGPEAFFVNLSSSVNAALADRQGTGTILDDDSPPVVALTNPAPGLVLLAPASVALGAEAYDVDGTVTKVEFYANALKIGTVTNGPRTMTWSNVAAGNYLLRAVATDNAARTGTSAPVTLHVIAAGTDRITYLLLTNAWRFDQTTNNYGNAWTNALYDDSAWEGPSAALFYNETAALPAPKNTPLLLVNGARLRTYYFRTTFVATNTLDSSYQLIASNLVDDGAVFYLNGREVGRLRISGTPGRTTLASGTPPPNGDAEAFELLTFPSGAILAGTNLLAVEVHQQSDSSTDVVFGMSLAAVQGFAPVLLDPSQPADQIVLQNRPLVLSINATGAPAPAYQWYRNSAPVAGATNATFTVAAMAAGNAGSYFVRLTNSIGQADSRVATIGYAGDTTPPTIFQALGSNVSTRVFVAFSEPVSAGATVAANYTLTSLAGGTNLPVSLAALFNSTGVVLTTGARLPGVNYLLTVNGVRDLMNNLIATNSQAVITSELLALNADSQAMRYYQFGAEPGAGWTLVNFDDTAANWSAGLALFDAKNPAGRTTVNTIPVRTPMSLTNALNGGDQTLAYYFRAPFYVPGQPGGARLRLRTLVDDGAIFYLNGQEVLRLRMPGGPADYATLANVSQADAANIFEGPYELPAAALLGGTNVLAVEVHQASATSSDVSFAAQLFLDLPVLGFPAPVLQAARAAGGATLTWSGTELLQHAPEVTGPWTDVPLPAGSPYAVAATNAMRYFRLRTP